jgi:eukaryotic-like serine/threonine-protein kinase
MRMDRWEQIENVYHIARGLRAEERSRFLSEQRDLDSGMRRTVEALLVVADAPDSFLNEIAVKLPPEWTPDAGSPAVGSGRSVGQYEVLERIDSGGMADVYRARDPVLKREVALKVLPPQCIVDPDRLARFKREAEILAALNHPNIAAIYGFEESDGVQALVLELVEGPTLADRIVHGPIPFDDAISIARQITNALEAAHERGVIHRDLKPANIKVRLDGAVKLLDFGLAKALDPSAGEAKNVSPTVTSSEAIRMGVILGTAAYMSPEQAKGSAADKRSDVWAFGCVLYEMLTGKRAFRGENVSDTLASVLRDSPDWSAWPENVPAIIRTLVEGCLQKDRQDRIGDMSTARFVMDERRIPYASVSARRFIGRQSLWKTVALVFVIASIAGFVGWVVRPTASDAGGHTTRFSIALPGDQRLQGRPALAISPDGTELVYSIASRLYLRSMSDVEARPIAGTDGERITSPVFSPDGRSIVFWSGGERALKKVAVSGGTAVTICQADGPVGITWDVNGIVFGQSQRGIFRVSAEGGAPQVIVKPQSNEAVYAPQVLPGGRHILFTVASGAFLDSPRLVVQISPGERKTLVDGASDGRYLSSGHIVYAIGGKLFVVSFDLRRLEVTSQPVQIIEGVARTGLTATGGMTGIAQWSVSTAGTLAYIPGPAFGFVSNLAVLDRTGQTEVLKLHPAAYESPRFSPDGKRIVFGMNDGKNVDLWTHDLDGTTALRKLTFGGRNRFPIWSPDGQYIAFQSDREGDLAIYTERADLDGGAERLSKPDTGTSHIPEAWSPKGDALSFSVAKNSRFSLSILWLRDKRVTAFGAVESDIPANSAFSPEQRWIAYQSGRRSVADIESEVFVQPFPANGTVHQIASRGAAPMWSADGKELFYSGGPREWVVATVTSQPSFSVGNPIELPTGDLQVWQPDWWRHHDVTRGGRRIGLIPSDKSLIPGNTRVIQIVLNWLEELKQRVPVK